MLCRPFVYLAALPVALVLLAPTAQAAQISGQGAQAQTSVDPALAIVALAARKTLTSSGYALSGVLTTKQTRGGLTYTNRLTIEQDAKRMNVLREVGGGPLPPGVFERERFGFTQDRYGAMTTWVPWREAKSSFLPYSSKKQRALLRSQVRNPQAMIGIPDGAVYDSEDYTGKLSDQLEYLSDVTIKYAHSATMQVQGVNTLYAFDLGGEGPSGNESKAEFLLSPELFVLEASGDSTRQEGIGGMAERDTAKIQLYSNPSVDGPPERQVSYKNILSTAAKQAQRVTVNRLKQSRLNSFVTSNGELRAIELYEHAREVAERSFGAWAPVCASSPIGDGSLKPQTVIMTVSCSDMWDSESPIWRYTFTPGNKQSVQLRVERV